MSQPLTRYIAPSAPAANQPAQGDEAFLHPEVGFMPRWYRDGLGINLGRRWHIDVEYRRETALAMRKELRWRFPETRIGGIDQPDTPELCHGLCDTICDPMIEAIRCLHVHQRDSGVDNGFATASNCSVNNFALTVRGVPSVP